MKAVRFLLNLILIVLLTIITQVGGLIFILYLLTRSWILKKCEKVRYQKSLSFLYFLFLYFLSSFFILPLLAKPFGRVPLPLLEKNNLQPLNVFTCILNRNYVREELRNSAFQVAEKMNAKYPGTVLNYLDANFPFLNGFPLIPHLSHNDGKKLDLSFCYKDAESMSETNACPSIIGYGICEEPLPNEINTAASCSQRGNKLYSLMKSIYPQGNKKNYVFDARRTADLVGFFAKENSISKIFIEPHLKSRLGLNSGKVVFHGCHAVRHDDHVHVQIR